MSDVTEEMVTELGKIGTARMHFCLSTICEALREKTGTCDPIVLTLIGHGLFELAFGELSLCPLPGREPQTLGSLYGTPLASKTYKTIEKAVLGLPGELSCLHRHAACHEL